MLQRLIQFNCILLSGLLAACASPVIPVIQIHCHKPTIPITGYAQSFAMDTRIQHARVKWLETGKIFVTNQFGQFAFCAMPHSQITLLLTHQSSGFLSNYHSTQTGTLLVTHQRYEGVHHNVTIQAPREFVFNTLKDIIMRERKIMMDPQKCQVVTTITAFHKTLQDDPQGESHAHVSVMQNGKPLRGIHPFYFGIFLNKTNPFSSGRTDTSADGGVLIYNIRPSRTPYYLTAVKFDDHFSTVKFICRSGSFINISPPYSPSMQWVDRLGSRVEGRKK